jgi:KDO2-lipid IV(A) lauroyltransferase
LKKKRMGKGQKKNSSIKRIGYFLGRTLTNFTLALARRLPLTWLYRLSALMGWLGLSLMAKRRKIVYHNLQMAFRSSEGRDGYRAIAKATFCDSVKNALEVAKLIFSGPSYIKGIMSIEGLEHLERALGRGRGVVAVSAHMGNFPLIGPRLIAEGYRFSLLLRDPKDTILAATLADLRKGLGLESIPVHPSRTCIAESLKCLKRNGILYLQIDQNASSRDLWVDFFGWEVPTFKGPVVFSMRTGAPLIPLFTVRDAPDHHMLIIAPPFKIEDTGDRDQDILITTAKLTKLIESYIRQYPAQWWWFHRRWKKARRCNEQPLSAADCTIQPCIH